MRECSWLLLQAPEDVHMSHEVGSLWSLHMNGCSMHHTEMYFCISKRLAGYMLVVEVPIPVPSSQPSCAILRVVGCGVKIAR
jgi:hypothetical protein